MVGAGNASAEIHSPSPCKGHSGDDGQGLVMSFLSAIAISIIFRDNSSFTLSVAVGVSFEDSSLDLNRSFNKEDISVLIDIDRCNQ